MPYCAILAEYNPFHQGHLYQIKWVQENLNPDGIIIWMTGSFVQRGDPALWDKWSRAAKAIEAGADVVIEYPAACSVLAATDYAYKAVEMMHLAGITHQIFGVESASLQELRSWIVAQKDPGFQKCLRQFLEDGNSFAKASWLALVAVHAEDPLRESVYRMPNHILGRQYINAHERLHSAITPMALQRKPGLPSASDLRQQILSTTPTAMPLSSSEPSRLRNIPQTLFSHLTYRLWQSTTFTAPYDEPGLNDRIIKALQRSTSWEDVLRRITTKHHSRSHMRRHLLHSILGYDAKLYHMAMKATWPMRLLQVKSGRGESVLKYLAKNPHVPICKAYHEATHLPPELITFEENATDYHHFLLTGQLVPKIDRTHHFTLHP